MLSRAASFKSSLICADWAKNFFYSAAKVKRVSRERKIVNAASLIIQKGRKVKIFVAKLSSQRRRRRRRRRRRCEPTTSTHDRRSLNGWPHNPNSSFRCFLQKKTQTQKIYNGGLQTRLKLNNKALAAVVGNCYFGNFFPVERCNKVARIDAN